MDKYIEAYGRRLFGLCMHLTGRRDEAEDLYQETWLRALDRFSQYDPSREFGPWISRICVNVYRDLYRRRKRSPFYDFFGSTQEKDAALEGCAEVKRDYSELSEAVAALDEKLRITVILYYFNGLDQRETAATLGIPVGTVKSRLNAARGKLREMMKDEE